MQQKHDEIKTVVFIRGGHIVGSIPAAPPRETMAFLLDAVKVGCGVHQCGSTVYLHVGTGGPIDLNPQSQNLNLQAISTSYSDEIGTEVEPSATIISLDLNRGETGAGGAA